MIRKTLSFPLALVALLALPLALPAAGADELPVVCDPGFGVVGCGCIVDATTLATACGAVFVTCDTIGNGVGAAEGVATNRTTAWRFDFSVTSVGYANSQSSTGAVAAFKDVSSPLVTYNGAWTVHGSLYADGQLVASGVIGCA